MQSGYVATAVHHPLPSSDPVPLHCLSFGPFAFRLQLAVRDVAYHPRLPLFASAADDATIHIYHGRVYADLLSNPLIVPLKILRGHAIKDHIGVLSVVFHPTLPWVFSAAADGVIHLYTD